MADNKIDLKFSCCSFVTVFALSLLFLLCPPHVSLLLLQVSPCYQGFISLLLLLVWGLRVSVTIKGQS